MPWLIKDRPQLKDRLFFVHVPRCGGTSLMHHFDVPQKAMQGKSCWGRFGMRIFFHRYKLLEKANFPIFTFGNALAIVFLIGSVTLSGLSGEEGRHRLMAGSIVFAVASLFIFLGLSFIFTAPTISRFLFIRRCYLIFVHYILCRFMESIEWCTGTNRTGYMMHLTAQKLLSFGYVTAEEMEQVCTMAIVRNPYSRMISIYNYNKFGSHESFSHFVQYWYDHCIAPYLEQGEMDEWYIPCHAIPQFEFTHYQGKQLVQSIVKQEELKYLKTKQDTPSLIAQDSSVADLPQPVLDALLGMPHTNARVTKKKWYEYYDQHTLNLVYEMYQHDFNVFDYSPILEQRPDLEPPALYLQKCKAQEQAQDDLEHGIVGDVNHNHHDMSFDSMDHHSMESSHISISSTPSSPQRRMRANSAPDHLERFFRNSLKSPPEQQRCRSATMHRASQHHLEVGEHVRSSMTTRSLLAVFEETLTPQELEKLEEEELEAVDQFNSSREYSDENDESGADEEQPAPKVIQNDPKSSS